MDNNILIGGATGQGMKSLSHIISIARKRHGYHFLKNTPEWYEDTTYYSEHDT